MNNNYYSFKYVIGHTYKDSFTEKETVIYDSDTESFYGGNIWVEDILKAKRFDSFESVMSHIMTYKTRYELGFSIINIPDCTWDAIKKNDELRRKFNDPYYALRG